MHTKSNQLINEKSPYLLQHANNPVDWYPWGNTAFVKAKLEDKPIFLSIGYSTCHWCHVMERESFEDAEVAALLNQYFVAIKVDREERPDVDHIYMKACQIMTGQGGWPLTIIMTAEKRPFFAGTYFPKHQQHGRPGLMEILKAVKSKWTADRGTLLSQAEGLSQAVISLVSAGEGEESHVLPEQLLDLAYENMRQNFDPVFGGFSQAPKFPTPHYLMFLLRYWKKTGKAEALQMVEKTLTSMQQGGIYDHVGGGFARYSTDERWLVPHFEKMLYDNALLLIAYVEAYQCTGKQGYADIAEQIVSYIKRDMNDVRGGFYSAEDADSEGVEGKFYLFTQQEVIDLLGEAEGKIFCAYYGITAQGNFMQPRNILNTIGRTMADFAKANQLAEADLIEILDKGREKLFAVRKSRVAPYKDDKVLTAWNALMIAALAIAGRVLQKDDYVAMAKRAMRFIEEKLIQHRRVLVRYREEEAALPAYVDDYAFLIWAFVELYESTYELGFLKRAKDLALQMKTLFYDQEKGGFFFSGVDVESLLVRHKELYDGAIPSGNSVAILALQRLADLTGNEEFKTMAKESMRFFMAKVQSVPEAHTFFLAGIMQDLTPGQKLVIAAPSKEIAVKDTTEKIQRYFLPHTAIVLYATDQKNEIAAEFPDLVAQLPDAEQTTIYLCKDFHCLPPITDLGTFEKVLYTL